MFTLCHNKSPPPPPQNGKQIRAERLSNWAPQSKSGEEKKKKGKERTTAPFSLWPVDMKDHIMSEIRGNYTGSAL